MKKCINCGMTLQDTAGFCGRCGAVQQDKTPQAVYNAQQGYNQPQRFGSNKTKSAFPNKEIGRLCWALTFILLFCVVFFEIGKPIINEIKFKSKFKIYCEGRFGGDYSEFAKIIPEEAATGQDWDDVDEYIDYRQENSDEIDESLEEKFGDDFTYTEKIVDVLKLKGEEKKDTVEDIADRLDVSQKRIKAACNIYYVIEVKGEEDGNVYGAVTAYKLDGKWYLDDNETEEY